MPETALEPLYKILDKTVTYTEVPQQAHRQLSPVVNGANDRRHSGSCFVLK